MGAPGADQGALLCGRSGGGRALPRDGPPLRLPAGPRRRDRRRGAEDEGCDRPVASRQGQLAPQRQARRGRHSRGGVPRPGAPAPLRGRRPLAAREEQLARDLPPHRARLSLARPRAHSRRRARPPAHGRASPADPPRVPDAHAAGRGGGARAPRAAHGHRPAAGRGAPPLPRRARAHHARRAPGVSRVLRGAARRRRTRGPHPELYRAQGHRLHRSRSRAPEPAAPPGRPAPHPVSRGGAPGAHHHVPRGARRALADARSRRGPQPVRAPRRRGGAAHRVSRAARRALRSADEPPQALRARRAGDPDAHRAAGAARRPRRSRDPRRAEGQGSAPARAVGRLRAPADPIRATRPAAPHQAGPRAGHHLAHAARASPMPSGSRSR